MDLDHWSERYRVRERRRHEHWQCPRCGGLEGCHVHGRRRMFCEFNLLFARPDCVQRGGDDS